MFSVMKKEKENEKGIHVLGELFGCDLKNFAINQKDLEKVKLYFSADIYKEGLQELGSCYHFFGPNAVTGIICLAESHISFHTWPEDNFVTLDIHICRYGKDNTYKSEVLFDKYAKDIFRASRINKRTLNR